MQTYWKGRNLRHPLVTKRRQTSKCDVIFDPSILTAKMFKWQTRMLGGSTFIIAKSHR
jgi:hypothetical protein